MKALAGFPLCVVLAASACREAAEARESESRAPRSQGVAVGVSTTARHISTLDGFNDPESVLYDAEQDVYFVSNIMGLGSNKDATAYITRVSAGTLSDASIFVEGGKNGAVLDAPKGMTIQGDTLWVTDIDVVRGFNRRTGAPVGSIDFSAHQPRQLNDIALGPDGTLRVTDTGIYMVYEGNVHTGPDRIFAVGPGHVVTTVADSTAMKLPNGITWDAASKRWVVVSFDPFVGEVASFGPAADTTRRVLRTGKGRLDGVEALGDGGLIFSSWADSSIHLLKDGRDTQIIREVPEPADIGYDTRRRRVAIPLTVLGQVQIWALAK
jgi:hypothetical protein